MSKEVVKSKNNEVAVIHNYGEDAGAGHEGTKPTDLSIPFINLLQAKSVMVENCDDGSVRAGMMYNTVTGETYQDIVFLPVYSEEAYVEWVPRIKGGGFVGVHQPDSEVVLKAIAENGGSKIPKKGADGKGIPLKHYDNELVETFYMYGLILNNTGTESEGFCVIAFTSTKIKIFKNWKTAMFMLKGKPPLFANRARILTQKQSNNNQTSFNFEIKPFKDTWLNSLIPPGDSLLAEAKSFGEMIKSGMAKADFASQSIESEDGEKVPL